MSANLQITDELKAAAVKASNALSQWFVWPGNKEVQVDFCGESEMCRWYERFRSVVSASKFSALKTDGRLPTVGVPIAQISQAEENNQKFVRASLLRIGISAAPASYPKLADPPILPPGFDGMSATPMSSKAQPL